MSSFRFLSLNLLGGSLLLLLTAVCEAQEYSDFAPTPDYDSDYNATFEYSFFSNTSTDDLEKFSEQFIGKGEDEGDEGKDDTGEEKDQGVSVTVTTTRTKERTKERTKVEVGSAASLPVSLELRTLIWTVLILIFMNSQQL
ncbi:uncharacterized protein ACNS7B_013582 isoform 1-T2 [Menidia menidia]